MHSTLAFLCCTLPFLAAIVAGTTNGTSSTIKRIKRPTLPGNTKPKPTQFFVIASRHPNRQNSTESTSVPIFTKKDKSTNQTKKEPTKTLLRYIIVPPTCKGRSSCSGRCTHRMAFQDLRSDPYPSCFCDPLCDSVFQDCCADYDQECNATWMKETFPSTELDSQWQCSSTHRSKDIWMITSCGPDWREDEVSKKCTEPQTFPGISVDIPVISENNITFRNRYCALCNNVKIFTPWKYDVECDVVPSADYSELESIAFLDSFCTGSLTLYLKKQLFRYCNTIITECRYQDDKAAVEGCQTGATGLVTLFMYTNFRNIDCLRCSHKNLGYSWLNIITCGPNFEIKTTRLPFDRRSFSFIFKGSELQVHHPRCPDGHIFDKVSRDCKKLLGKQDVPRGKLKFQRYSVLLRYEEKNNSCRESIMLGGREKNRLRFSYVFENLLDISLLERGWHFADLNVEILGNSNYFLTFQVLGKIDEDMDTPLQHSKIDKIIFHSKLIPHATGGICKYSLVSTVVRAMFCAGNNNTYVINKNNFSETGTIFVNETQQYYYRGQYVVYNEENETRIAVCKDFRPVNCSYYLDVKNRTSWKMFANRSIYSDVTASLFDYGEYSIVGDTLWLCLTKDHLASIDEIQSNQSLIHQDILSYVTLVTFIISIISLVLLLVVYSVFPSLRNLPGKNLMLLCVVLALGQLLWLLQSDVSLSSKMCVVVSVALQYLYLSTLCCSTSIVFHSFITFHGIARGKLYQSSSKKHIFWYAMFGLGFPLVVVSVFWLLDLYKVISLTYVGGLCWFADRHSLYVAFIAPVFIILFVNIILLVETLRLIYNCTKESQKIVEANGGPSKEHVGIYFRMSTLTGLTWMFGIFVIVFPEVLAFDYLFVVTNGLQGFYIAVAFLFTDSMKKKISRRLFRSGASSCSMRLSSSGSKYLG